MLTQKQQSPFWIADWQVNPALGVIEKDSRAISLEPKVMAVLLVLASNPGQVYSRSELEQQVWRDVIVGYDALAKAINKLREALGDDKKNPRYIQTISKKGYRLIAKVSEESPHQAAISPKKPSLIWRWRMTAAFLLIATATLLLLFIYLTSNTDLPNFLERKNLAEEQKPTIAVLPFRNIGRNDNDDYLADGLTSDLTTNLSKLSSLWVTASNATLAYKKANISAEQIKKIFNARYVLSGEVNKFDRTIRINVLLSDINQGTVLWAERYDREFTDLFAIQDEVTQKIISELSLTLSNEEKRRIAKRYTSNFDAYEIFLRAQYMLNARTPEDNSSARELLFKAIEIDSKFARAYAALSYSYSIGYLRNWPSDTDQPLQKAVKLANKALELDDELPESYWAVSFVYFYQGKLNKGREALYKALELNPNYADAYALLASHYISSGRPEISLQAMDNAYRLNPIGGYLYDMQRGRAYYFMDKYNLALKYLASALERNSTFIDLQMYTAATYIRLERYDEAGWILVEAKQTNPDFDAKAWVEVYPFVDGKGYRNKLLKDVELAESYSKN